MEFRVLGPLEARDGDRLVPLGAPRQRAVLAILLSRANEVVSVDRLVADLWAETPPESAPRVVQTYISQLRKVLGPGVIGTRPPGYVAEVTDDQLDLRRFEALLARGSQALVAGNAAAAAPVLREALALWRGAPFADFAHEPFARPEIGRLEELRLVALERRFEADLACGRHAELVGELEALSAANPLRERLRWLLMLALYRSGRQAEALEAYRDARRVLVGELGLHPSPALQELETAILRHDPSLSSPPASVTAPRPVTRSILVVSSSEEALDGLLAVAVPLAVQPARELIVARLLAGREPVGETTGLLAERRGALEAAGISARVAAYTSERPGEDATLLATEQDVDLLLIDAPATLVEHGAVDGALASVLEDAPCDVGIVVHSRAAEDARSIIVPFGGVEHDWAAVELAAWIARSRGVSLTLLGTAADRHRQRRDASRLLARASLMIQQVADVVAEPLLVEPGATGVLEAARRAGLLVLGLSARWRDEGLGPSRLAVARDAPVPTLFVHRGLRPGGLAPRQSLTRFTWTLAIEENRAR